MFEIDLTPVEGVLGLSIDLLRRTYAESPAGGGGWYHMLERPTPGATATAVALLAFHTAHVKPHHLPEALAFLKARQLQDADPLIDGGWWTNTSGERPVVEATAWVVRCLATLRCDSHENAPDLARAVAWLRANRDPSGGWGSFAGCPPRTWNTCLAIQALLAADPYDPAIEAGVAWLLDQRLFPDAWGAEAGATAPTTVAHTAMVLTTLLKAGVDPAGLSGRFDWLLGRVDPGSLNEASNRVEHPVVSMTTTRGNEVWRPPPLVHYALPVATTALLRHPRAYAPDVAACLAGAVATIVGEQSRDGSWPNNHGSSLTLWGVWPCVEALAEVRQIRLVRPGDLIVLVDGAAVVRRAAQRDLPLRDVLAPALPKRPDLHPMRWARLHWTWVLLAVCSVGGAIALLTDLIEPKDLAWGLLVPVGLLVIQAVMQRKQG
ncbi:prenyltransferase/squalene oxidase repeat-containing protein [Nonomuraea sp. NPDC002799]